MKKFAIYPLLITILILVLVPFGCNGHPELAKYKIAFISSHEGSRSIYAMNGDGTEPIMVADGRNPSWLPGGTKIVYRIDGDIYTINADGNNNTRLTGGSSSNYNPVWTLQTVQ
jgi:Tol biopolymer transport system component